jgi:FkbM family methyltransferase
MNLQSLWIKIWYKIIPHSIKEWIKRDGHYSPSNEVKCFSQEGEDMVLLRFFENKADGFYVDIGAHHPIRFSNTYLFYLKGWKGINVDAMPGSMEVFKQVRPRDINVEVPISDKEQELLYYIFNEKALNTFSAQEAQKKDGLHGYRIVEQKSLKTRTLSSLLDEYLPDKQEIDFFTIDVEGLDYQVLKSNNWEKYRPTFILVEDLARRGIKNLIDESEIYQMLSEKGYDLISKTVNTLFFKKLH